ncbi:hypothetical protein LNKW23_33480 [Paralimibaculum aggregatum]|uniref:Transmembrane family 220 protein n=1 Tax=Paralimibaculum aggregatum TaxID=3036245 RepID=A0ABQ6LRL9_9RHOB|nr:transmembrane 220 family protein [Limibaculum sp. NKW23]GMG84134.1 hypothetical protein LNKW23_33480 [Limibaculum sp. NKW23]
MRALNGLLLAVLLLFAAVQYNDPDGPLWLAIYGTGALWTGLAALRPGLSGRPAARAGLALSLAAALAGLAWYWPATPGWWRQEVWWETETAREGMGMMIVVASLAAAALVAFRRRAA